MTSKANLLTLVLTLSTASATYLIGHSSAQTAQTAANTDYQIGGTLYMQKAAEYRALAYQAFNIARLRLDQDLKSPDIKGLTSAERRKPRAVMVDIDETVLDNSPAQAYSIIHHTGFVLKDWYAWGEKREAKAIPGAVDFLNYAVSRGVKVFFVSNRDDVPQKQATIDNLRGVGFKDVSTDNVLLRKLNDQNRPISTKEPRRDAIRQEYRIVLFCGDNLDDHSSVFENRPVADRFAEVEKARDQFGDRYIMLPNAIYGTWENAIYGYKSLTDAEKTQTRLNALELP